MGVELGLGKEKRRHSVSYYVDLISNLDGIFRHLTEATSFADRKNEIRLPFQELGEYSGKEVIYVNENMNMQLVFQ